MGLPELSQIGWYKAEPTSSQEIAGLFGIVNRCLADLQVEAISDDLRFQAAYNGILTLATIALRASGYRVSMSQGHHQRAIESLAYTLTSQPEDTRTRWVRKIKVHSQKRNIASYDLAGSVSSAELAQIVKDLQSLHQLVSDWLSAVHPDLTPTAE